jgi:hypothetical protein
VRVCVSYVNLEVSRSIYYRVSVLKFYADLSLFEILLFSLIVSLLISTFLYSILYIFTGACGSIVVKALCCKLEDQGFDT